MNRIRPYLQKAGLTECGAVPFESCLPLLECRAQSRLPENARSVILCAFPYYTGEWEGRNLSRYAIVPDYHRVAMDLLTPICSQLAENFSAQFVPFADNSPIREVDAALRAGLGVLGANSLLINPRYGSWVFLGEIVTDLPMEYTEQPAKRCIGCGACAKACPGQCIQRGKIEESRCLSAITQVKRELSTEESSLVKQGGLVWGCDRCQEVCPYNKKVEKTPLSAFLEDIRPVLCRKDIAAGVKERAYGFRGPKPLLRNLEILESTDS